MRIGLLADIHEDVERLQSALRQLRAARIDQVVVLGDVRDLFQEESRIEQTCRLLTAANAVGVWGNHDFSWSVRPDPSSAGRDRDQAPRFMATLRPRLEIDGCFFSHVEPWLDPEYFPDLWFGGGPPSSQERLARIFGAVAREFIFAGHYHAWVLARPTGVAGWHGETKVALDDGRYFVAVGALCNGDFGICDTSTRELVPLRC